MSTYFQDLETKPRDLLKQMLADTDFSTKKAWGQNFLVQPEYLDKIVASLNIQPTDLIWEIGMGPGLLSRHMAESAAYFVGIEKDFRLKTVHDKLFEHPCKNSYTLMYDDALKLDFRAVLANLLGQLEHNIERLVIFSNVPYYISTELICKCVAELPFAASMYFMLESDIKERLTAPPGSKAYGTLAVMSQVYGVWQELFKVPGLAFMPKPHAESSFFALKRHKNQNAVFHAATASDNDKINPKVDSDVMKKLLCHEILSPDFQQFVKAIFVNRRKNLKNVLSNMPNFTDSCFLHEAENLLGKDFSHIRAENLEPDDIKSLYLLSVSNEERQK